MAKLKTPRPAGERIHPQGAEFPVCNLRLYQREMVRLSM